MLDSYKKKSNDLNCLKSNCLCNPVIVGPTGPRGKDGRADTIRVRRTMTGEAGSEAKVIDTVESSNHNLDFIIPMGPTGPAGPLLLRSAYLVTFNHSTDPNGVMVNSLENIPIERVELDVSNLLTVDMVNNTIKFNVTGYYKIFFTISAYPQVHGQDFDPTKDIVSVGFREHGTDNVYVGVGEFVYNGEPVELTASGIIAVVNTDTSYELANLGKYPIYLETPDMVNISSDSYFANSLVTIVIDYLGRQGT